MRQPARVCDCYLGALAYTTLPREISVLCNILPFTRVRRYIEMVRHAATAFPASVYEPPPESASNAPALNLNLGGVNVSLGGPGGSGVYRTSGESGVGVQADGIRDGVLNLLGKVKQGVDRIATPQ